MRPSKSKGGLLFSSWRRPVRTLPSSSRSHRPTGSPWLTWTQNADAAPDWPTIVGGSEDGDSLVLGGGGDTEGLEHGNQRGVGDASVPAGPVHVFGCDAMEARQ